MRTIRVTGKGNMRVRPDQTRINMTLTRVCGEYAEALERATRDTETLKELLTAFDFAKSEVKTLNFSVDAEYESYREQNEYKQRLVGYRFRHTLKVDFPSDNQRLGKILYALARCDLQPEFGISYNVKDEEAVKKELLDKAMKDAKEKAEVLTRAAGLTLKEIQSVDYSFGEMNMEVRPAGRMLAACKAETADNSFSFDVEPDDVKLSDTVTVVWEIE